MRALIVGCGYTGAALARRLLQEGHAVTGVVRSPESANAPELHGLRVLAADAADPEGARAACACHPDAVVLCVSSRGGDYRRTYVETMRRLLEALEARPPRVFVYTGSTSVYAQTDGGWVAEDSPAEPPDENGRRLLETEGLLREGSRDKFDACVLRLAGLYGPGRHAWLDRLRAGAEAFPGGGNRWLNQIHRDDAVGAILHIVQRGTGVPGFRTLNVADDTPVLQREYTLWLCEKLGRAPPRFDPALEAQGRGRKGFQPNRRVSNRALRALGWSPRFPSWREGMEAILSA